MHSILLALAVATLSTTPDDAAFEKAKKDADTSQGLSGFIEKYVGDCGEGSGPACKKAAEETRKKLNGKKLYAQVSDTAAILKVGEQGDEEGDFTLNLTPFFAARGYAVTSGAPTRTDANGNPVMSLVRLAAHAPDGDVDRLGRMISMRQLVVELVFIPQGTWQLKANKGVKAKLVAIRVSLARTNETVAIWHAR